MRRCITHALYRSKFWQQDHCQHPQNVNLDCHEWQGRAQGDENKVSNYGYGLWCGFKWRPHHTTSHLHSRLESQHQSVPRCAEEFGDPLVQSGGWWLHKECYDFVPFSYWLPSPPNWTRWTTSFGHTSWTSPTWPPTTPKLGWSPPSAEYSPSSRRRLRKRHAPSTGSVSRQWLSSVVFFWTTILWFHPVLILKQYVQICILITKTNRKVRIEFFFFGWSDTNYLN